MTMVSQSGCGAGRFLRIICKATDVSAARPDGGAAANAADEETKGLR
jgi:hypothetical protein